jgi:hypothetical protein
MATWLIWFGAGPVFWGALIAAASASVRLIMHTAASLLSVEAWFVVSSLLAPPAS